MTLLRILLCGVWKWRSDWCAVVFEYAVGGPVDVDAEDAAGTVGDGDLEKGVFHSVLDGVLSKNGGANSGGGGFVVLMASLRRWRADG